MTCTAPVAVHFGLISNQAFIIVSTRIRHLLLCFLLGFSLTGMQAMAASSLHDHGPGHSNLDCGLCHAAAAPVLLSAAAACCPLAESQQITSQPAVAFLQLSVQAPYSPRAPPTPLT